MDINSLRNSCWDRAFYCYATAEMFNRRLQRFRRLIQVLTFMGIIVPVLVGGTALSFGTGWFLWPLLVLVAGLFSLLQLCASVWCLSAAWNEQLEFSLESVSDNNRLCRSFRELAQNSPVDIESRFLILREADELRMKLDERQGLSEKEMRYGHRSALREFERKCVRCGQVPYSMQPSDCPVCGQF